MLTQLAAQPKTKSDDSVVITTIPGTVRRPLFAEMVHVMPVAQPGSKQAQMSHYTTDYVTGTNHENDSQTDYD